MIHFATGIPRALFVSLFFGAIFLQNFESPLFGQSDPSSERLTSVQKSDWLIDSKSFSSKVIQNQDRLILTNGLVRREFVVKPEVATVSFSNAAGQELIRAVRPEAEVTVNGKTYSVGGLVGQPNQAFLTDKWIKELRVDPNAMKCIGIEEVRPKAPFGWKRVRHHAKDSAWPPKGIGLRFDYALPKTREKNLEASAGEFESNLGRKLLYSSSMKQMDPSWKVHRSKSHPRSSFQNEGKVGEIYTPANSSVFIEKAIPTGAKLIETEFNVGTDHSASWGPGLAVVFESGKAIKFHVRPQSIRGNKKKLSTTFGLFDGKTEDPTFAKLETKRPGNWKLRVRLGGDQLWMDAKSENGSWASIGKRRVPKEFGNPKAVRIGKMDLAGNGKDFGNVGELVRLKFESLSIYGELNPEALKKQSSANFQVSVHYELYNGVPTICKWIEVKNLGTKAMVVDRFKTEILALVERDSQVETRKEVPISFPNMLHVETDFAFGGFTHQNASRHVVHYRPDKTYKTQVNYSLKTPCLLEVSPTYGPSQTVAGGGVFQSYRTYELAYDSEQRERRSLSLRRMYRIIAPWTTENPLMHHLLSSNPKRVRQAIDEAASVGFEMIILSFGSGFNMENDDPAYLAKWKEVADYAKSKNIELGAYSLLSSRRIGGGNDIVPPKGVRATHGVCPALTSEWGLKYYKKLYAFFQKTGFDLLEHDGPYPGDVDTTARPPYQKGEQDSRWVQWKIASNFYRYCRENGIYVNAPDYYFLSGSNKCGMGYREVNWSLPRAHQIIHTRQNIYDGTWYKTPSMGWMFVPLSQYHGGGAAATIEPLHKHQDHYRRMIQCNLAFGVQACFRGPRLFDTDETKALVKKEVDWFKKYREVLEADVIHGRRADGRNLDWMLHVNPGGKHKGMLVVFNPTETEITKTIRVPLYYTGIKSSATFSAGGENPIVRKLSRDFSVSLPVTVPAGEMTWVLIESNDK